MLSIVLAAAIAAAPAQQCKCGVSCACPDYSYSAVAVITERAAPVKVCAITDRPPAKTTTVAVRTTRAPKGDHTHTCTKCGATWDHVANATHTCQFCGGHPPVARGGGFLADPSPRPVTVVTTKTETRPAAQFSSTSAVVARASPQPFVYSSPVVFSGLRGTVSNCANGQCSRGR